MANFIWHASNNFHNLNPITQVYGVCFDKKGNILIIREPGKKWNIPGGHPDPIESPVETLKRELAEEVDVTINASQMIGYYEVTNGERIFQLRYAAKIDQILTQTTDPASGKINERIFVPPSKFFDYVEIKDYRPMLDEAVKWYNISN